MWWEEGRIFHPHSHTAEWVAEFMRMSVTHCPFSVQFLILVDKDGEV